MDYTVIFDTDLHNLTKRVLGLLSVGWELQGSISISISESDEYKYTYFAQALIKKSSGVYLV